MIDLPRCCLVLIVIMQPACASAAGTQTVANPLAVESLDDLTATRQRPLFKPDRQREIIAPIVVQEAPPPAPLPVVPPQVSLLGVIDDPQGPRAVVRSDPTGKLLRLTLGDDIGGWHVTEIEGQRLVMSLDDRSIAVKLFAGQRVGQTIPILHQSNRVLEVNEAGILRSHHIHHAQ
jgi:general secretion pathway protein N